MFRDMKMGTQNVIQRIGHVDLSPNLVADLLCCSININTSTSGTGIHVWVEVSSQVLKVMDGKSDQFPSPIRSS